MDKFFVRGGGRAGALLPLGRGGGAFVGGGGNVGGGGLEENGKLCCRKDEDVFGLFQSLSASM